MNNYFELSDEQKRFVLHNAEERIHLPAVAIEKDLWVTCILQVLFSMDADTHIIFKGGTSLSKVGNLIERFSEDIDIAIKDNDLWASIQHHRAVFTSMRDVDYSVDFRKHIVLCPPEYVLTEWQDDYNRMCQTMIYGDKLPFDQLLARIKELEERFRASY